MTQKPKSRSKAFGLSHTGRVRQSNEDAFMCNQDEGIFVVCDGMGGAAAGEVASHLAAEKASASLSGGVLSEARMVEAVAGANRAVFQKASSDRRLEGMGTTLVTLALNGQHAWIAHVGDSRCYRWRASASEAQRLERLTMDHSLVEEQVRLGQITRSQAERSPFQHVITRAIGTTPEAIPDVRQVELQSGDVFLLASDGLTRELSDEDIASALSHATTEQEAAEALVLGANSAGGRDNITCVLVHIE